MSLMLQPPKRGPVVKAESLPRWKYVVPCLADAGNLCVYNCLDEGALTGPVVIVHPSGGSTYIRAKVVTWRRVIDAADKLAAKAADPDHMFVEALTHRGRTPKGANIWSLFMGS